MNKEKENKAVEICPVTLYKIAKGGGWGYSLLSRYEDLYPLRIEIKNCSAPDLLLYLSCCMGEKITAKKLQAELDWWQRRFSYVSCLDLMEIFINNKKSFGLWEYCLFMPKEIKRLLGVFIRLEGLHYDIWDMIRRQPLDKSAMMAKLSSVMGLRKKGE